MANTLKSKECILSGGPDSDKPSLSVSQLYLEEQRFSQREAQRTLGQRVRLYLLRFLLNLTVVCLLAGAFYLIFFATEVSQTEVRHLDIGRPRGTHSSHVAEGTEKLRVGCLFQSGHHWLVSLFLQYLPPITITGVNLFLPQVFRKISSFEDYSFTTQVNATLVR